jgi:Mlo family
MLKICIKSKKSTGIDGAARRLLAASGAAAAKATSSCGEGKEPIWSSNLIHKVHILIFLIAISHVLYAMLSIGVAMHAVRKWRKYEQTAQQGELLDLPVGQLQRQGEHKLWFGLRQGVRQFTHPIDQATFVALRRMFIETVQVRSLAAPWCP